MAKKSDSKSIRLGLDRQIDALVHELYALTSDEIKIVKDATKSNT